MNNTHYVELEMKLILLVDLRIISLVTDQDGRWVDIETSINYECACALRAHGHCHNLHILVVYLDVLTKSYLN